MYPPDSSIVYRPQPAAVPAYTYSHRLRVAPEPEACNVRLSQPPGGKMTHLMTNYDVDVRRHHDLLPAQQLVMPSLQLLSGFHPAAAAASSESSPAWPANAVTVPAPVRDAAGQQVSINYEIDAAESSSYLPWYSQHLMDSYNNLR